MNLKRTRSAPGTPGGGAWQAAGATSLRQATTACSVLCQVVRTHRCWATTSLHCRTLENLASVPPLPPPHTAVVWTVNRACLHGYHKLPINYSGLQNRFRCFLIAQCVLVLYFSLFPFRFRWMVCLTSSLKLRFSIEMCL